MALLRNPANIPVAVDTQVLVSFADDPKIGRGSGLFGDDWHTVGILADGSGITQTRDADETEIRGLHYGTLRTIRRPGRETLEFEVIEDNPITRRIANPSERDGVLFNDGKRLPAFVAVVFVSEAEEGGNQKVEVIATRYKAALYMEEIVRGGEDVEGKTVTAEIIKGGHKDSWDIERFTVNYEDGDMKLEPIRFVDDAEITSTDKVDAMGNLEGNDTVFPHTEADRRVAGGDIEDIDTNTDADATA